MDFPWDLAEELRLAWGILGFNSRNSKTEKLSLLMVYLWNIAKELRLELGTLGFNSWNSKNKKAIIADGFSVEYGGGAGIWTLGGL